VSRKRIKETVQPSKATKCEKQDKKLNRNDKRHVLDSANDAIGTPLAEKIASTAQETKQLKKEARKKLR